MPLALEELIECGAYTRPRPLQLRHVCGALILQMTKVSKVEPQAAADNSNCCGRGFLLANGLTGCLGRHYVPLLRIWSFQR